jgi:hypothetical protein
LIDQSTLIDSYRVAFRPCSLGAFINSKRDRVRHELSSHAEAIKYATDTTLVHEDEITVRELIQLLAERLDELDESDLP